MAQPLEINGVVARNRVGFGPINTGLHLEAGAASFYARFARAGFGIVYIGGIAVSAGGRSNARSPWIGNADTLRSVAEVAAALSAQGALTVAQIMHAGRQANASECGVVVRAATSEPCPVVGGNPRALHEDEVASIVEEFAVTARAVVDAGADLVEIHGAHGYLVDGFLSPDVNDREDRYKWSPTRSVFLEEVLSAVKERVSVPVGVRVSARHHMGDDNRPWLPGLLGATSPGPDFVAVSAGTYQPGTDLIMPPRSIGELPWRNHAEAIKTATGVPVLLSGNATDLHEATAVVRAEMADAVLFARSALADPELLVGGSKPCTECGLCKWHSRGEASVYCPFNNDLVALRRSRLRRGWRPYEHLDGHHANELDILARDPDGR